MLQKLVNNNRTYWDIQLYTMLFSYRTAYKVATGHSPFELVYGLLPLLPTKYIDPKPSGQLPTSILPSTEYWQQEQPTWTNWTKQDSRPRPIKDKPNGTEPNGYKLKVNLISSEWEIMYCGTLRVQTYTQENYAISGLDPTEFNTYYQTILYS